VTTIDTWKFSHGVLLLLSPRRTNRGLYAITISCLFVWHLERI